MHEKYNSLFFSSGSLAFKARSSLFFGRLLCALGADASPTEDGLIIVGKPHLSGGEVDSQNDHRIAMSAAIASLVCQNEVTIRGFEAINKSYPTFGENFE